MFIFKLLQGFGKQWKEQSSSNEVPWVASPCVLASLSTWRVAPGQGSSPNSPGWTVLHHDVSSLPDGLLSSFCCRAASTVYLSLED